MSSYKQKLCLVNLDLCRKEEVTHFYILKRSEKRWIDR